MLTERGDTVTENALLAAARHHGVTVIRNASPNYMVQDLCFFLTKLGVQIDGIGTTTLTVHGVGRDRRRRRLRAVGGPDRGDEPARRRDRHRRPRSPSGACRSSSSRSSSRCWRRWASSYDRTEEYLADNGHTRLVDLTTHAVDAARADRQDPPDAVPRPQHRQPAVLRGDRGRRRTGQTMIHDWVYENRAIYLTELNKLGAAVTLLDPHRVLVEGPTRWSAAELMCPPALRPAVVILLAMLAAKGTSVLRNVYVINRGYEDLAERLNALGAQIETFRDI